MGRSLSKKTIALVLAAVCCIASLGGCSLGKSGADDTKAASASKVQEVKWEQTVFGASTSDKNNTIEVDDANKAVTINAGSKDGSKAGGKVTASNDGISYYYASQYLKKFNILKIPNKLSLKIIQFVNFRQLLSYKKIT